MESNVNSVLGNERKDTNEKIIGSLTKNNSEFKFKIEELENFALKMYNELPNHRFVQKLQKDIILINQNISSQNEKLKYFIAENINIYKILSEQKKKQGVDMKEFAHKNLKSTLDVLLKDKISKISGEVGKLGELFEKR